MGHLRRYAPCAVAPQRTFVACLAATPISPQPEPKQLNQTLPKSVKPPADDLCPEYEFDFSKAERGRYAKRLKVEGSNLVMVEPELAKTFPDSASVNAALRSVVEFAKLSAGMTDRSGGRSTKRKTA